MNVVNRTDDKHLALPMKDKDGFSRVVVIVKQTWRATPKGAFELDDDGPEPYPADVPYGEDPVKSSVKAPSDLVDFKPGTDVILRGRAWARPGATYADVTLRVGRIDKTVRAHGVRVWQRGIVSGLRPGPAMPIRGPIPLRYELAWGGLDDSQPDKPVGEPRNYVGRGVARNPSSLIDQPAAQLELPSHPIGERGNVPACFGAVPRHWLPRSGYAGTYDKKWQETRMPLLPADFDPRFNVTVPHDQWSIEPLHGDEPVEVLGATEEGEWRFQLPFLPPLFSSLIEGNKRTHHTHLDTMLIDADDKHVELTWRTAVPAPPKLELIDEIRIARAATGGGGG